MIAVAWGAVIAVTCVVGGGMWWWLSREREIIAPLPIGLGTIAVYVVPRAMYLLVFGRAPLTSAGLTQAQQVALISSTTLAALVAAFGMLLGHRARWAIRSGTRLRLHVPAPDRNRGLWVGGVAALVGHPERGEQLVPDQLEIRNVMVLGHLLHPAHDLMGQ